MLISSGSVHGLRGSIVKESKYANISILIVLALSSSPKSLA